MEAPATEHRQYTEALVEALIQSATGDTLTAEATAAVEIAAGFWSRAFATATITPAIVPAHILATIGRDLVRAGESVWQVVVESGRLELLPVAAHNVEGGRSESSWTYRLQVNSPSNAQSQEHIPGTSVVHCRYSYRKQTPWLGISPLGWAVNTAQAMGRSEARMKEESGTPTGYVMPTPADVGEQDDGQGNIFDPFASLRQRLGALAGKLMVVQSMQTGFGEGRAAAPQSEWTPRRLGANPPESLIALRNAMQEGLLAACGVPPGLASADSGNQTANREAWRQFLHGTIQPVAVLVEAELREKLNQADLSIDFDRLFASIETPA